VTDWVYRLVVRTALGLFRVLGFRFTIEGEEHVPEVGGAVVVSNHVSYFDFMFVGLATRPHHRLVRFMAKKSIFDNPVSGPLMRGMHHIPVDRGAGASAYAAAVEALRAGELVGVFPESTISRSFQLREIKSGAARMAIGRTGTRSGTARSPSPCGSARPSRSPPRRLRRRSPRRCAQPSSS
jgi:1-acyl-sn-glycerol-3-phosphate acyltransferase